jgi:hypothetical protein
MHRQAQQPKCYSLLDGSGKLGFASSLKDRPRLRLIFIKLNLGQSRCVCKYRPEKYTN